MMKQDELNVQEIIVENFSLLLTGKVLISF